ncbi:carbon-nitrogen hydrolase family protein [Alteribacillus bidgolensis]|uniref:Predicted amidohydrolase n=1 Tax=Alteribacillus bidgolensis TaxID=930129 RepID=A0A1G8D366_9BACI|nr:Predicted amidohydrolase [Alteribacillus bidgolensis]
MTKNSFKICLAQQLSFHGEVEENKKHCAETVRIAASKGTDLVVFPELTLSGYHAEKEMFFQLAEPAQKNTPSIEFFRNLSEKTGMAIVVSFPERSGDQLYIMTAFIDEPKGQLGFYRKSKLWGAEKEIFSPGPKSYDPFSTRFGRIGILLCFDMEFPEPARELAKKGTDLIICPSVWSKTAKLRWDIQLPCRALDNQCYVAGVNTISDNACGSTQWIDPFGKVLQKASIHQEELIYGHFDKNVLEKARSEIPYLKEMNF